MKYKVTYYRDGRARRFLFATLPEAVEYCGRVFKKTGLVLCIEAA